MVDKDKKIVCDVCGGTGQVSFFKGVSRFLLSTEECDQCAGMGCQFIAVEGESKKETETGSGKRKTKKK